MGSTANSEDTAVAEKQELKEPSKYYIVVHDNDETSYEEVIYIVSKAFEMQEQEAFDLAQNVDKNGKGICGVYSKEIAETKLVITEMIKESLVSILPYRGRQIKMLKFTMEKA